MLPEQPENRTGNCLESPGPQEPSCLHQPWALVILLETLTASLMLCSLIFQGEEGEDPTSSHHHHHHYHYHHQAGALGKVYPLNRTAPSMEKLEENLWDPNPKTR